MPGPFASLSDLVLWFENRSANPTALNYAYDATHTASGLYQVTNTTWGGYGGYPTAASAPVETQQAQFAQMVGARGLADYSCPGCDAKLSSYLASNPEAANLPVFASQAGQPGYMVPPGSFSGAGGGTTPNSPPGGGATPATGPSAATAAPGTGASINPATWLPALGDWFASIAARAGLFILALLFIAGAIVLFGIKSGIDIETRPG
jgi:hypothetical protein